MRGKRKDEALLQHAPELPPGLQAEKEIVGGAFIPPPEPLAIPLKSCEPPGLARVYCGFRGGPGRPLEANGDLLLTYFPELAAVLIHRKGFDDEVVPWAGCVVRFAGNKLSQLLARSIAVAYGDA